MGHSFCFGQQEPLNELYLVTHLPPNARGKASLGSNTLLSGSVLPLAGQLLFVELAPVPWPIFSKGWVVLGTPDLLVF